MKNILTLIIFLLSSILPYSVVAQSFRISHIPAGGFSFDKFTNEVYYSTFYNIYIKNLNDSTVRICPFPSLPEFAHNSHKCVYGDGDSIIIYNFDNNNKFLVYDSLEPQYYDYVFSPDDEYLLFYQHYFSFADSSVYPMIWSPAYEAEYEWANETTVILLCDEHHICSYNFVSNIIDTIFVPTLNIPISTFSYNRENQLLYYSLDEYENPKIYLYNPSTHIDSVVFDSVNDSADVCWDTYNWFQSMEWSPDNERMVFFSFEVEAGGTIYTFYPDNDSLYRHTFCGGEGYEYYLRWLNNDTIAYVNGTTGYVEGFILGNPLAVKEVVQKTIPASFEVSSYPNPFNGAVTINLKGIIKDPEIRIYNINGEEIKRFDNLQGSGQQFNQVWNGRNNSGENVSSGVYFIIVRDKADPLSIKGTSKIVYLK
jgi:hypothetical protein